MAFRIFLSYGSGDEDYVGQLFDSIGVVSNLQPYVAEWIETAGVPLRDKVAQGIDGSSCLIAFYTYNGMNSEWMNQEVGYAYGKKVTVIPIKDESVELQGFLQGIQYIKLGYDLDETIANVLNRLRSLYSPVKFWITCPKDSEKFLTDLPSQQYIFDTIAKSESFIYNHQKCGTEIIVNAKTLRSTP